MTVRATATADPEVAAIRACRRHLVHAALFSALLNLLYLAPTLFMLQVYDRVIPTRGEQTLVALIAILVFAVGTIGALDLARSRLLLAGGARLDRLLGPELIARLINGHPSGRPHSGALLREFDAFRQTVTGPGAIALFDAPWSIVYLAACFLLHPLLGVAAIAASVILTAVALLNERVTRAPMRVANAAAALAGRGFEATLASAGAIRALGMQRALVARHVDERDEATARQVELGFVASSYVTVTKATRLLLQSLALALGAWLAIEQRISPGAIFAASLLMGRALSPVEQITGSWKQLVQARETFAAIRRLLAEQPAAPTPMRLPDPVGQLAIEGLSVASPDGARLLIQDVSFALEPGDIVGIIGPSGAGKSTLVKAIVGALPASAGTIRLDGASLADWPADQLAPAIGYVPQEPSLFAGSIRANVSRFASHVSADDEAIDREVMRVSRLCGTSSFILRLPNAFDTDLSWGGTGLSVGQAQRIALSRAIYGSPQLVILDEPNANLDAEGEAHLAGVLRHLRENKVTVLIVAHRTGVLDVANKLLVMRDGRLAMCGDRADVVRALSGDRAAQAAPVATQG